MITTYLQNAAVGLIVVWAAVHVARRVWQTVAGEASQGCGSSCGGCPSSTAAGERPSSDGFVPLESLYANPNQSSVHSKDDADNVENRP